FTLPDFADVVEEYVRECERQGARPLVGQTISEFLAKPIIFVNTRDEAEERYREVADTLPPHEFRAPEKGKASFELEFASIDERDVARDALMAAGLRIRTGKTLVPFRITGNIDWGIPVPELDPAMAGLTVWCWPESLWAPISFTQAVAEKRGLGPDDWKRFWTQKDAVVYQFIGQDNLYFYGVAQPALWVGLQEGNPRQLQPEEGHLQQAHLIANHHILYGKSKASSSGAVKPPSADELLEHYTAEQLRAHFLALALDQRAVAFKPKVFDPDPEVRDNPRISDPVLKEASLLTKVFNRLARSCFYEAKNKFDCCMPLGTPADDVRRMAYKTLARYERTMAKAELHTIMQIMDEFIRWSNKRWSAGIKRVETGLAEEGADVEALEAERRQLLVDCFYLLRVCTLLMHPVAPVGCEMICEYFQLDPARFFSWDASFSGLDELCPAESTAAGMHPVKELLPRVDFFPAHPSQFK
ncbi:MAG: class I tRNA ligase family protein, partial [Coriobacteriaceae bacterium]|nr:class I tRNA ligase family protein [Coriobacteriaceae bacterium]